MLVRILQGLRDWVGGGWCPGFGEVGPRNFLETFSEKFFENIFYAGKKLGIFFRKLSGKSFEIFFQYLKNFRIELHFHKIPFDPMRCLPLPADAGSRSGESKPDGFSNRFSLMRRSIPIGPSLGKGLDVNFLTVKCVAQNP